MELHFLELSFKVTLNNNFHGIFKYEQTIVLFSKAFSLELHNPYMCVPNI